MGISKLMGQKSCGLRMQKYIFLGQGETFLVFRILTPYGIWLFIDWYDCFFLDWVLFANMKMVRLPGAEHMGQEFMRGCFVKCK